METTVSVEEKDNYLHIVSVGERKGFEGVVTGAKSLYAAAQSRGVNFVLMDCSRLRYVDISNPDAFNLVRFYEQELPAFSQIVISTIGNDENYEIMEFWESICLKRGYQCKVFPDYDQAKQWLDLKMKELG